MRLIQIFGIIVIANVAKSFIMDPICASCLRIDSSLFSRTYNTQKQAYLTQFQLPGFSLSSIIVDLRHLNSLELISGGINSQLIFQILDLSQNQTSIIQVDDLIIGSNQYQLQTTASLQLTIYFSIRDDSKAFGYLLRDSISLNLSYSNNRLPGEDSSYVFVVTSTDNINLPLNKPDLTDMKSFYLQNEHNDSSFKSITAYSESTMYWSTDSRFVVPYFPYFSNCQGEGSMMHIMEMLQNQSDCSLVPINQTGWISEFSFGSSAVADRCSVKRKCTIDGDVDSVEYPKWITLPAGLSLFEISQEKIPWKQFGYDMQFEPQKLVMCKINSSKGSNNSDNYPLKVKLSMGYYQVSQTQKKIISCLVEYDLYVPSSNKFTYQLQIVSYPLNHTYIMLNFGFKWYVYMIVFVIIGVVGNVQNFIMWIYHYFVAEERKQIKLKMYLRIVYEIIKGTSMALILEIMIIIIVSLVMNGKIFQTVFYQQNSQNTTSPRVIFDYILENPTKNYDSSQMKDLRAGRMGVAFIVIGIMVILLKCQYFIGKEKNPEEYKDFSILGRIFKPLSWNRGKFLFTTFFYIILMYFFIYFAYSTLYSSNIWLFILLMKVLQVIMEEIANSIFGQKLPGLPLKIITDITAYLNTVSAADLYDFLFGSLIDVAVTMVEKIYIFQIQNMIVDKIVQKSEEFNKFYQSLMNQEDGDDQAMKQRSEQEYMIKNDDSEDNQQVFIRRQAQQVEFFEEQVKQVYVWTKADGEAKVILECKDTENQRRLKRKYFEFLQRDYRYQRQLLFKDSKELNEEEEKQNRANQHKDDENLEAGELAQKKRQETMQRQSNIFDLLLDHMAMIYTFLVNPFVVFIFWLTYDESAVLTKYGIVYNTVVLYILSALVIGVFSVINIIMIFHILQSYMMISFEEQINDILSRFNLRKTFWKADEEELNDKLKPELLGADHYCLSSQLFFILTVYVGGMILVILGLAIVFKAKYNIFDDIATIPIIFFWAGFLHIFIIFVKKTAIFLNVWDYKNYQKNLSVDENGQNSNPYAIMDQKQLIKQMQQNSDLKTQNIIFSPIQQLPNYKNLFNPPKLSNTQKQNRKNQSQQLKRESKMIEITENIHDVENNLKTTQKKKNKWLIQQQQLTLDKFQEKQQFLLAQKRIEIICQKLEPHFAKDAFKLQFSKKNCQYIKENIEKILPLVESLPELQEFKNLLSSSASSASYQKARSQPSSQKPTEVKRQQASQLNKNMDPVIAEIILEWLRATEKERVKRINTGLEDESKIKKCSFCYETWGLYYGHGGTCLACSMRMAEEKKESGNKARQKEIDIRNRIRESNSLNQRIKKKRKTTKKRNNLNVIEEESNKDEENGSLESSEESMSEMVKTNKKYHQN